MHELPLSVVARLAEVTQDVEQEEDVDEEICHDRGRGGAAAEVEGAGGDLGELASQDLRGSPVRSSRSRGLGPVRDRPYSGPVRVFGDRNLRGRFWERGVCGRRHDMRGRGTRQDPSFPFTPLQDIDGVDGLCWAPESATPPPAHNFFFFRIYLKQICVLCFSEYSEAWMRLIQA